MGCNKRGFGPDRLELSLSLPPSSRLACGVPNIEYGPPPSSPPEAHRRLSIPPCLEAGGYGGGEVVVRRWSGAEMDRIWRLLPPSVAF